MRWSAVLVSISRQPSLWVAVYLYICTKLAFIIPQGHEAGEAELDISLIVVSSSERVDAQHGQSREFRAGHFHSASLGKLLEDVTALLILGGGQAAE